MLSLRTTPTARNPCRPSPAWHEFPATPGQIKPKRSGSRVNSHLELFEKRLRLGDLLHAQKTTKQNPLKAPSPGTAKDVLFFTWKLRTEGKLLEDRGYMQVQNGAISMWNRRFKSDLSCFPATMKRLFVTMAFCPTEKQFGSCPYIQKSLTSRNPFNPKAFKQKPKTLQKEAIARHHK